MGKGLSADPLPRLLFSTILKGRMSLIGWHEMVDMDWRQRAQDRRIWNSCASLYGCTSPTPKAECASGLCGSWYARDFSCQYGKILKLLCLIFPVLLNKCYGKEICFDWMISEVLMLKHIELEFLPPNLEKKQKMWHYKFKDSLFKSTSPSSVSVASSAWKTIAVLFHFLQYLFISVASHFWSTDGKGTFFCSKPMALSAGSLAWSCGLVPK